MTNHSDFNDLANPAVIAECIDQAKPMFDALPMHEQTEAPDEEEDSSVSIDCADQAVFSAEYAAVLHRLSDLPQHEYDRVRKAEAKTLGIRTSTLDADVETVRTAAACTAADDVPEYFGEAQAGDAELEETDADGVPSDFIVSHRGVFYMLPKPKRGGFTPVFVSAKLRVTALVRDEVSHNWGRVLEFADADGSPHQLIIPMAVLAGDGTELRKELAQRGLELAAGNDARNRLLEYVMSCKPAARARCVQSTGWFGNVFVLPDRTVGNGSEHVLLQAEARRSYTQSGTLHEWQQDVARLCVGNSRLTLALCVAFAGPLLYFAGQESGGVNFFGPSSIGKTTILAAASSVFGGPSYIQTWRATANGLEGLCALHTDTLLVLDEMGEVDPKEAGAISYMIGNGAGKTRSDRHGDARAKKTWRLLFLSSGEVGLAQHMGEGGKVVRAGQEVRLVDLPADAGAGLGVFEELHGFDSGAALSNAIKQSTRTYYGTAGIAYIEAVAAQAANMPNRVKDAVSAFVRKYLPEGAGGQAARVCARFGLIAAAGELATYSGITGWPKGTAHRASAESFRAWLEHRGGAGNQERAALLAKVRAFFETHGESRFTDMNPEHERATINRAGFRTLTSRGQQFYVLPEAYKRDVCAGLDPRVATKILLEAGWLMPDKEGKSQQKKTLPGMGETRVYVFSTSMWEEAAQLE